MQAIQPPGHTGRQSEAQPRQTAQQQQAEQRAGPDAPAPPRATFDATLVVLATAPHTVVTLPAVAAVATALRRPCRPTAFDLAAVPATVALARAQGVSVNTRALRGLSRLFAERGLPPL